MGIGVLVILIIGSILITANLSLLIIVHFAQQYLGKGIYPRKAWILDETLQLQRKAYESAGQGTWTRKDKSVPITLPAEKLQLLGTREDGFGTDYHLVSGVEYHHSPPDSEVAALAPRTR
jgi:hypothetical protein